MSIEFKYCPQCRSELERVPSPDGWSAELHCSRCLLDVHVVYGDAMGGSSDHYSFSHRAGRLTSKKTNLRPPSPGVHMKEFDLGKV